MSNASIFTSYRHQIKKVPDTPPQAWPPGMLFRRWEGSKALPEGCVRGALTRRPEHTNFSLMAPRESTKASKNYANKAMVHMTPLQAAIALAEDTEMAIQGRYIKTIGDEINSSQSKAKLATLARHFRLKKLNDILVDIVEMENAFEFWHKKVKAKLPNECESCVQSSARQLQEVSKSLHQKWVSAKSALDAQHCLNNGKYLESKIAHLHDTIEEILVILRDLVSQLTGEDGELLHNLPEMPFTKLSLHKKILALPGKYVVVEC